MVKQLGKADLGMALAGRLGLAGADELYVTEFQRLLSIPDVEGAIRTAACVMCGTSGGVAVRVCGGGASSSGVVAGVGGVDGGPRYTTNPPRSRTSNVVFPGGGLSTSDAIGVGNVVRGE